MDFDSTYVFSRSTRRQGVDRTYKKRLRAPPASVLRRRDRAPPSTPGCAGARPGRRPGSPPSSPRRCAGCPRGSRCAAGFDSGFYSGALFEQLETCRRHLPVRRPAHPPPCSRSPRRSPDEYWRLCLDKDEGEVAEFGYRMRDRRAAFAATSSSGSRSTPGEQTQLRRPASTATGSSSPTTTRAAPSSSSPSTATRPTSKRACASSSRTSGLHAFRKHGFMANWAFSGAPPPRRPRLPRWPVARGVPSAPRAPAGRAGRRRRPPHRR